MIQLRGRHSNKRASWNERWDSVVEKVWKNLGGNQEEAMSAEKFGRYETEVKDMVEKRERAPKC